MADLDYLFGNRDYQAMPEPKGADMERMDAVSSAAVMPCVGGFIFYVGQSHIEDRPDFENQNASARAMVGDATGANRKRTG